MTYLFLKSMHDKEKIIIFYIDSTNQITQRTIRVLQLHDNHILAYCYYRKKVRMFKLENILSADKLRKKEKTNAS